MSQGLHPSEGSRGGAPSTVDREGALPPKEGSAELRAAAERGALELTAWGYHTFGGRLTSVGRDIGKRVGDTRVRLYP